VHAEGKAKKIMITSLPATRKCRLYSTLGTAAPATFFIEELVGERLQVLELKNEQARYHIFD